MSGKFKKFFSVGDVVIYIYVFAQIVAFLIPLFVEIDGLKNLAFVPALERMGRCVPWDASINLMYIVILVGSALAPFAVEATVNVSKLRISFKLLGLVPLAAVAYALTYFGLPFETADGAGALMISIYCESVIGSLFLMLLVGLGPFITNLFLAAIIRKIFISFKRGCK